MWCPSITNIHRGGPGAWLLPCPKTSEIYVQFMVLCYALLDFIICDLKKVKNHGDGEIWWHLKLINEVAIYKYGSVLGYLKSEFDHRVPLM